jgi:hypothetical protein
MSNVVGRLRQRSSSEAVSRSMPRLLEMSLVPPHSPPPFFDRCCVVAKVARAVPLASAALFSNDHSRADLPLACTGWLLVVNINQRLSRERSPPPVLLKPQHALRPVFATATAMRLQLRCLEREGRSSRASFSRSPDGRYAVTAVFHTSHTSRGPLSRHKRCCFR